MQKAKLTTLDSEEHREAQAMLELWLSKSQQWTKVPSGLHSSIPFTIPLYHHKHVPSRSAAANKPVLGYVVGSIQYTWQALDDQRMDTTVERLLSPKTSSTFSSAMLENALKMVNLSKATRDTLKSVYRLFGHFQHGMDRVTATEWLCGILLLQRYYEQLPP